ncbi:glycosyltransferase [Pseudooceanicola spongiae]|uniref:Glycosyltransferase n=2 Tax=Pseudooceanicola spongiae TaxID=2613965 RepID=A0A7L9WSV1_9RHOB|nr:glycosyltransferase [Pseudooceanicola spongiae]
MRVKPNCILVLGMHRSGTSACTRVLSLLGAALPDSLMPSHETNVTGFWESPAFMDVNDAMLAEAGSSWDDWTAFDESALEPDRLAAYEARIAQTIRAELGNAPVIVLKDPRIARFVPLYLRVLQSEGFDVRCVHITRNPCEVAQSLEDRDGFSAAFSSLLWLRHTLDAEQASRSCNRIFLTYQGLMSDEGATIRRLAEWGAGVGLSSAPQSLQAASRHLESGLRHFADGEALLAQGGDALSQFLATTYTTVTSLSGDPMQADALAKLDDCAARLNWATELCGPAFHALNQRLRRQDETDSTRVTELETARSEIEALRQAHATEIAATLKNAEAHAAELAAMKTQVQALCDTHAAQLVAAQQDAETSAAIHASELAAAQGEQEVLRRRFAAELTAARSETETMRRVASKFLRSPLVPLADIIRYYSALKMSKLLENSKPAASRKFARSAAKRDPKRFMTPGASDTGLTGLPTEAGVSGGVIDSAYGAPTVLLPFAASMTTPRHQMRIAVVLHVYALEQAAKFRDALKALQVPFSLFISTDTEEKANSLRKTFGNGPAQETEVRVMPNRGRDIAPKLVGFADIYDSQDLVLFLHAQTSQHTTDELNGWRDQQLKSLLGSRHTVNSVLYAFSVAPELGMVAPPNPAVIRKDMDWSNNYEGCRALAERMGITLTADSPLDFPAGAMFWARPAALRPLLDAGITLEDFPEEAGQKDSPFVHAVERLFFYSCEAAGLRWIHAGAPDQLADADMPLAIEKGFNLEWALSDQMPALMLPGIRPRPKPFDNPIARLASAKDDFRAHCKQDLARFLASDARLVFDAPGDTPKVSIALILYNQAELTFHCLQSLHRNAGVPIEIILLDNGSSDDTGALLDRLDGVTILRNGENLHFLRGVNRAAQEAHGEHFLLLNNDARVLPGTIPSAVARLEEDESIGAVGGPIVLLDGSLQEAGSIIFNNGSCLGYGRGRDPGDSEFRFRRDVDYCSGAFLMMRRAVWEELGGFDEAFAPAYYEETDLCMRIREGGRRVVYDPDVKIVHFEFGSSSTSEAALALQRRNVDIFRTKHAMALAKGHLPVSAAPIRARQRHEGIPRLLVIDDRVPMPHLGSGFPRAARMLNDIGAAGWSVTLYSTAVPFFSCETAYQVIPRTTELLVGGPILPMVDFLRDRIGCYDAILVSRPHNMVRFRQAVAQVPGWERVPVLYDAEAIFAERDAALAQLGGGKDFDYQTALRDELALAEGTQTVFSVSQAEAAIFGAHGNDDVRVLGHAMKPRPLGAGPEGRRNMLFVGALDDDNSPNTDSLIWFINTIMPRIDAELGTDWSLDVAGRSGARDLRGLASDRVRILGKVDDLDPLYAQSRLFIAPTRYAAGIPMKVHEATSVGLPTVATDLLTQQLGWTHGQELLSAADADAFAACCVQLYRDDALWSRLRAGGLAAIERDCDPERFGAVLAGALWDNVS